MEKTIAGAEDVRILVDIFYERVLRDELLGPIFNGHVERLPAIKEKMYEFWVTILLNHSINVDEPLMKHEDLQLNNRHFVRWLTLFLETIDDLYSGSTAEQAKFRAIRMAEEFQYKLNLNQF